MTFPKPPGIPTDIFGDEQPPVEEEPRKTIGDKIRKQLAKEARQERGDPVLQDWYREAIQSRAATWTWADRHPDRTPVVNALSITEEKQKNTRTLYPSGNIPNTYNNKSVQSLLPPDSVSGVRLPKDWPTQKIADTEFSGSGYDDTVDDNAYTEMLTEAMGDWTAIKPQLDKETNRPVSWTGEVLPPRAYGWSDDGLTPRYGDNIMSPVNKYWDTMETLGDRREAWEKETEEAGENAGYLAWLVSDELQLLKEEAGNPAFRTLFAPLQLPALAVKTLFGTASIFSQLVAEQGEPALFQEVQTEEELAANLAQVTKSVEHGFAGVSDRLLAERMIEAGFEPPENQRKVDKQWVKDLLDRINPIKNDKYVVLAAAKIQRGDLTVEEIKDIGLDSLSLSRMAYSFSYRDTKDMQEFLQRTKDGEHPALVAEDMRDWRSEALGEAILDPLWLVDIFYKPVQNAKWLEKVSEVLSKPLAALRSILGDASNPAIVDDLIDALPDVVKSRVAGRDEVATAFGLLNRTGTAKKHQALKYARAFIDNVLQNVKVADEVADVFVEIARLTSDDRNIRKAAYIKLSDALKKPGMALTGPGIDTSILLRELLQDADGVIDKTRFIKGIKVVQDEGGDVIEYVLKVAERSTDNIFPTVRKIIDVEDALKLDPEAVVPKAVQNFFDQGGKLSWIDRAVAYGTGDNLLGKIIKAQKNISYSIFIALNPRVAMRGYGTDTVVIIADAGPGVLAHTADEWGDIATRWLGSEHPGMKQAFSKAELVGLDTWAGELTKGKYDNIRDLLTAYFKGEAKGLGILKASAAELADIGGKLLRAAEITNGTKILAFSVDTALRTLINDAMPSIDNMIASGIPEDIAKNIGQIIINERGDVEAARKILFTALSEGGEPIRVIDLMTWMDQPTKDSLQRFELLGRVEAMAMEATSIDELVDDLVKLFDEEISLGNSAATNFPRPNSHSATPETDIGHAIDGVWEAASPDNVVKGVPNLDLDSANELAGKVQANINVVDSVERAWQWTRGVVNETISGMVQRAARENPAALDQLVEMQRVVNEFFDNAPGLLDTWAGAVDEARGLSFPAFRYGNELLTVPEEQLPALIDEIWEQIGVSGTKPTDKFVAKDMMWTYVQDRVPQIYTEARLGIQSTFDEGMSAVYGYLDSAVGYNASITESIRSSAIVKAVKENVFTANAMDNSVMIDGVMKPIGSVVRGHAAAGQTPDAVRAIASWMNPNIGVFRVGNSSWDSEIVRWVNHYTEGGYTSLDNIPLEEVFESMNQYRAGVLEIDALTVSFDDVFGLYPDVRIASADVPAWSAVEKHVLTGRIGAVDRRHLTDWLMENGDAVKVRDIVDDDELIKYARELLDANINEAVQIFPESKITNEFLGIGEETTTARLWRGGQQVEPGAFTGEDLVYGTWDKSMANEFAMREAEGAVVTPVHFDIKNPYMATAGQADNLRSEAGQKFIAMLKEQGYDGIVDIGGKQVVSFSRGQASIGFAPEGFIDEVAPVIPPHDGSTRVTIGRDVHESQEELEALLRTLKAEAKNVWGQEMPAGVTEEGFEALSSWFTEADSRMVEFKNTAYHYGQQTRDFALHDYADRFGFDSLLSTFRNFHFWPTRTMYNWAQRLPYNPAIINRYLNYRDAMNDYHKDSPEWLRQYWNTNELFGFNHDNPIYVSLAGILDVYQNVTNGAGFTDPDKRATWWGSAIDQLDAFIPGNMGLIQQFAVAIGHNAVGEDEAARKWAGRSIPITQTLKGLTSILGINEGRGIDLDPSIAAFAENNDWDSFISGRIVGPYEEKRIAVAMGQLISKYPGMQEELLDQARAHEGELWDEAVAMVAGKGAYGNIVSMFTGISARVRSKDDLVVDKFWSEYIYLVSQYDNHDAISWRNAREELMNKYPFAETMLLGRKGTEERNISYGYAVMGRIAPGETDEVSRAAKFEYDIIKYFYDNKGDITGLPQADQDKLMIFFAEAGASIAIPDKTTKGEWREASNRYATMMEEGKEIFGEYIWDKLDAGYDLKGESLNSQDAWYDYLEEHPEVNDFMRWKSEQIINDSAMSAYYGSIDRLRSFWQGDMYQKLEEEFGSEIWDIQTQFWIYDDTKQDDLKEAWLKKYPELEEYWERKNKFYTPIITEHMVEYGEKLPEGQDMRLREDFDREVASTGAIAIADYIEAPDVKTYTKDEWLGLIGPENMTMAQLAWELDDEFPQDLRPHLVEIGNYFDLSYEELILSVEQAR